MLEDKIYFMLSKKLFHVIDDESNQSSNNFDKLYFASKLANLFACHNVITFKIRLHFNLQT